MESVRYVKTVVMHSFVSRDSNFESVNGELGRRLMHFVELLRFLQQNVTTIPSECTDISFHIRSTPKLQ